jgi:hypothetical protein
MARVHGAKCVENLDLRPSPAAVRRSSSPLWAQSALFLQRTVGNRAVTKLLGAPYPAAPKVPVGVGTPTAEIGVSVGHTPLAPKLGRVVMESRAPRVAVSNAIGGRGSAAPQLVVQRRACNFYVYDSTASGWIGWGWKVAAQVKAQAAVGGWAVPSGTTMEGLLKSLVDIADDDCDCVEEMQFFSHGSSGNAMWISEGSKDQLTAADFDIPNLDQFGDITIWDRWRNPQLYQRWKSWFNALTPRQRLLVKLRAYICGSDAEIYYRSCHAFQGKEGQEFAKKSASFWRSTVIGHTRLIGLAQPGRKELKPGQAPYWPESEGETDEIKWPHDYGPKKRERKKPPPPT